MNFKHGFAALGLLALLACAVARGQESSAGAAPARAAPAEAATTMRGPLRVNPSNRRYYTDGSGKAVFLTGSHCWNNFQDYRYATLPSPPVMDFDKYLAFLAAHNHNCFRLWTWESAWNPYALQGTTSYDPMPYQRPGPGLALDGKPKFDLTHFNQAYFDRMRTRVAAAHKAGIYAVVMLFNGFSIEGKGNDGGDPWQGHPFNPKNNVNGIDGGGKAVHSLANPAVVARQTAYVRKVIDTVNDLDNVLYEISNEDTASAADTAWQFLMIDIIHQYERTKAKQHPVGMTAQWPGNGDDVLFKSPADWISPAGKVPKGDGRKVILNDTDHSYFWTGLKADGVAAQRAWVWKNFTRGNQCLFMDPYLDPSHDPGRNHPAGGKPDPYWDPLRDALGLTRTYATRMNLAGMLPRDDLASSRYCLTDSECEYLVYLPQGGEVTVDLSTATGELAVEWLDPAKQTTTASGAVNGGAKRTLKAPFTGDAVLYLQPGGQAGNLPQIRQIAPSEVRQIGPLPHVPYVVPPAFLPLRFGAIQPRGWILQQMRRDLQAGFAGHLDELCHEASSDIFASGRNRPGKPNAGNAAGDAWWNGETEGNWRCGHLMLACLTGEPEAMKKAKDYVEHVLAAQDADGYLGIFAPELRYQGHGELWTQTCLFRGLLAYADARGDEKVRAAVQRAVDRTIAGYAGCRQIVFTQHDPMFADVLEQLYARTGERKYLDFGLRLYRECPKLKAFLQAPELKQPGGPTVFNACYNDGHGATVTEVMRLPLWFWNATGDEEFLRLGRGALSAMDHWVLPSGALVSMEAVDHRPQPWDVGYEYCTIFEREFTLLSALGKLGDAAYADAVEHLWFNAAQGSRVPDGTAVLYCSAENRLLVNDEFGRRQRFSPTHQHTAVCCNPNATRVASYYTAGMWMRPRGAEPAIAAMLYGPAQMTADIAGSAVCIEEKTLYPYAGEVELTVRPARRTAFCLWLRDPSWSRATHVVCPDAEVRLVGGFWQVRKEWSDGDKVAIRFDQAIRELPAVNGEIALQYGPLLYVLPVRGTTKTVKTYPRAGLADYLMSADKDAETKLALPAWQRANGFGFTPKHISASGANPDLPLDNPPVELEGKLVRERDGTLVPVRLVPMGAQSTRLRRVTFPLAALGKK